MVANTTEFFNEDFESCQQKFRNFLLPQEEMYCNWTWDSVLCWPPTKAGAVAVQNCPTDRGIDPTKLVYKTCLSSGRWEGRIKGSNDSPQGWTNYTTCFTAETWELFKMLYSGSEDNAKIKLEIAERTRTLEIVGFSVSLVALFFSLAIFFRFRGLRNSRTRIHKNLFIALEIQVVVRLTLYIDQVIVKKKLNFWQGIHNTPFLCETSYILMEYARTAMFMWMFVEGLYLHNMITVTVFHKEQSYYGMYPIIGWGSPVAITVAWAVVTATHHKTTKCWWGYNLTSYFWILEGPRMAVVVLNFLFLLNIIRVLVVKLRLSRKSEIEQVRKAVRATAVLLPLLGITNIISMSKSPLEKSVWEFALWSYATHFLTSFQGFFIAFLYCFLNGEVRTVVMKSITTYFSLRSNQNQFKGRSLCGILIHSNRPLPPRSTIKVVAEINEKRIQKCRENSENSNADPSSQWKSTAKADMVESTISVVDLLKEGGVKNPPHQSPEMHDFVRGQESDPEYSISRCEPKK